jgi:hypothetical protein
VAGKLLTVTAGVPVMPTFQIPDCETGVIFSTVRGLVVEIGTEPAILTGCVVCQKVPVTGVVGAAFMPEAIR